MLQIRLNKPQNEGGGAKSDTVTVACPDHLVLADLPVAKSLGSASASAPLKIVGRRSRRQLGERVHFCVQCDLPIAVYGRLSPCEHAFCLDCARTDSLCFLCEERIQKIQTIKMMEGLLICAAPGCLKSFLKKSDLESHIRGLHMDLIHQEAENDGNESEAVSARKPTASESTVQGPGRPLISQGSILQAQDRGEAHRLQPRDQPPPRNFIQPKPMSSLPGQSPSHFSDQQLDNNPPPGFDRPGPPNRYGQQTFDHQGGVRQDSSKQTGGGGGGVPESGFPEYPTMQVHQQPINFAMLPAIPPTQVMSAAPPPQFGYTLVTEGGQQFYGGGAPPYEMGRPELNQEQGSVLGFPPGPSGAMNIAEGGYPRPWSMGPAVAGGAFEPSSQGGNAVDSQGRGVIFQGGGGGGVPASNMVLPPASSKGSESSSIQGGTAMEFRGGGNGILAQQSHSLPPPPPPPSFPQHLSHHVNQGNFYSNEVNNDGQTFGWSNEKHDG